MRMTYDEHADAAYLYLDEFAKIVDGDSIVVDHNVPRTSIILQFDSEKRLVGIEILGARRLLASSTLMGAN